MRVLEFLPMVKSSIIRGLIKDVVTRGSYEALGRFMRRVVIVGIMHFMDIWNLDLDRIQKCVIHYVTPDGRVRPFCTYNSIHRDYVEKGLRFP